MDYYKGSVMKKGGRLKIRIQTVMRLQRKPWELTTRTMKNLLVLNTEVLLIRTSRKTTRLHKKVNISLARIGRGTKNSWTKLLLQLWKEKVFWAKTVTMEFSRLTKLKATKELKSLSEYSLMFIAVRRQ